MDEWVGGWVSWMLTSQGWLWAAGGSMVGCPSWACLCLCLCNAGGSHIPTGHRSAPFELRSPGVGTGAPCRAFPTPRGPCSSPEAGPTRLRCTGNFYLNFALYLQEFLFQCNFHYYKQTGGNLTRMRLSGNFFFGKSRSQNSINLFGAVRY